MCCTLCVLCAHSTNSARWLQRANAGVEISLYKVTCWSSRGFVSDAVMSSSAPFALGRVCRRGGFVEAQESDGEHVGCARGGEIGGDGSCAPPNLFSREMAGVGERKRRRGFVVFLELACVQVPAAR